MSHHEKKMTATMAPPREELSRLNRTFVDIFQSGNIDRLDEVTAEDYVDRTPSPGQAADLQGLKDWLRATRAAFPDARFTIEDELIEGDKIVARSTLSGTHTGAFQGLPPSGKTFAVQSIDILRVRDGKAVEHWGVFDALGLLQQLGFVQAPTQPVAAGTR
jgi:steroid delta-isomerase-like uncharacterized protein